MTIQEQFVEEGIHVRWSDVDGGRIIADLGEMGRASVDVVGETVIVVADDEQYEFEVPAGAQAFITNGVLTIEVNE